MLALAVSVARLRKFAALSCHTPHAPSTGGTAARAPRLRCIKTGFVQSASLPAYAVSARAAFAAKHRQNGVWPLVVVVIVPFFRRFFPFCR